jgi:predicted RNase H-like nuclease (RuvC/YqgF family)
MALVLLQGKVLPEVLAKFKEAQENSASETFNAFLEMVLEAYLNPKTKQVEVLRTTEEQQVEVDKLTAEIQNLTNENARFRTAYDLRGQEIEALGNEARIFQKQLNDERAAALNLSDDQIILTIPPVIRRVIEIEAETAKRKSGKEFSTSDILLNNFWESVKNGASHPFRVWSAAELTKVTRDLQIQQKEETAE